VLTAFKLCYNRVEKLPIIRKVLEVGNSKAITIPKSWFDYFEKETGVQVSEVAMEIDRSLTVTPVLPKLKATENTEPKDKIKSSER